MGYFDGGDDPLASGVDPMTGVKPDEALSYFKQAKQALYGDDYWKGFLENASKPFNPMSVAMAFGPGIMAGPKALTAARVGEMYGPKGQLGDAMGMNEAGAARDDIYNKTGWWRGLDDKWRYEIPDKWARSKVFSPGSSQYRLDSVLDHSGLAQAYPDLLRSTDVRFGQNLQNPGAYAEYAQPWNGAPGRIDFASKPITYPGGTQAELHPEQLNVLLHEIQHAVQTREGFAPGISPKVYQEQFRATGPNGMQMTPQDLAGIHDYNYRQTQDALNRNQDSARIIDPQTGEPASISGAGIKTQRDAAGDYLRSLGLMPETAQSRYWRTAGEVEARNVQKRQQFGSLFRETRPPWTTQSVKDADQIVDPNSWRFIRMPLHDETAPLGWGSTGPGEAAPSAPSASMPAPGDSTAAAQFAQQGASRASVVPGARKMPWEMTPDQYNGLQTVYRGVRPGEEHAGFKFVTTDRDTAQAHAGGNGSVREYRVLPGARIYPDPEIEAFEDRQLTGSESLGDLPAGNGKSAIIHADDLVPNIAHRHWKP